MKSTRVALLIVIAGLSSLSLSTQSTAGETPSTPTAAELCPLAELDKRPNPIKRVQPLYPAELKAARKTGEALITFIVDADGFVKNARIEKTTETAFGEAALAAISAWQFEPGFKNGQPVACQLSIPLKFALQN